MKLSGLQVNVEALEQGAWVDDVPDMDGLRLKVRGIGNKDWRKLSQKLVDQVPRRRRVAGRLDPEDQDRINSILLVDTGLVDWDGLDDDDGEPIPYSKELAKKLITDPRTAKFRDAVLWACSVVSEQEVQEIEDAAGN
jgi:hypothetical protein